MKFTNTITIDRQPDAVFGYLADLENLPRWNYAISETRKISPGPVSVGSRFAQTRTIPVRRDELLEVVEFVPVERLTIRGMLNSLPARIDYTLRSRGAGTALVNAIELDARGPVNLLAPVATLRIKSAVAANLDVLKQILEDGAAR